MSVGSAIVLDEFGIFGLQVRIDSGLILGGFEGVGELLVHDARLSQFIAIPGPLDVPSAKAPAEPYQPHGYGRIRPQA